MPRIALVGWLSLMHEVSLLRLPLVFGRGHATDVTLSDSWRRKGEYEEAGTSMQAQGEETATDRVYGPPTKIVANPGDVIIFDKRLGHYGGPARSRAELQQSGDDNAWPSKDPDRQITDASWHIHLDDRRQSESLLGGGADPAYYVHASVSSGDVDRGNSPQLPQPTRDAGKSAPARSSGKRPRLRPSPTDRHDTALATSAKQGRATPAAASSPTTGQDYLPLAGDTRETSAVDATGEDQPDRERDSECGVEGHLGSAKAAGETDAEFVL